MTPGTAWEQGLLVLAAGLWCVCWMVAMIFFFVVLPVGPALAVAIVQVLVGITGAMAPALLPHLGTPAVAAGLRFSPVVTLPALALMLCVLGRGQRTAASQDPGDRTSHRGRDRQIAPHPADSGGAS